MKRILFSTIFFVIVSSLCAQLSYTTADVKTLGTDNAKPCLLIKVGGNIDSKTGVLGASKTVYSPVFNLGGYLSAGTSAFGSGYVYWGKKHTSTTGKPHVTTFLQGSFDQSTWDACDTLGIVSDSAVTFTKGTFSYSASYIYPYYRFGSTTTASQSAVATSVYYVFAFKHD